MAKATREMKYRKRKESEANIADGKAFDGGTCYNQDRRDGIARYLVPICFSLKAPALLPCQTLFKHNDIYYLAEPNT